MLGVASLLVLVALLGGALVAPGTAHADTIEVGEPSVRTSNPDAITFGIRVTAPAGLESAVLRYAIVNPTGGNVGGGGDANFGPGAENDLTYTLEARTPQRYIPVGSRIRYHWELEDTEGDTLATEQQEFVFLDGRFQWERVEDGPVAVYYYGDEAQRAQQVLAATVDALSDVGTLLGVEVDYPVRVMMWRNIDEGEAVLRPGREGRTEFTRLGGERVTSDVLFLFDGSVETARHEAAHIVTHIAGDGAFARVPSWLDEGTAVYAQQLVDPSYVTSVAAAIAADETLSLRSINTPPGRSDLTLLFYGQSHAVVSWMIEEYGEEQFRALYQEIFDGALIDDALEAVYGLDQDGLYNAWRASVDLPPVEASAPVARDNAIAEATRAPLGVPTSAPSSGGAGTSGDDDAVAEQTDEGDADTEPISEAVPSDDDAGGVASALIVVGVAVVVAGLLGGGGFYLMRSGGSKPRA